MQPPASLPTPAWHEYLTARCWAARDSWRMRRSSHRGKSFADFYVSNISRKLDRGISHKTLGANGFNRKGEKIFSSLQRLRPAADGPVIDYGCGSLRLGQHFINTLGPRQYWGLDVTDRFFKDGVALLPGDVIAEKAPELHVISKVTLAAAAAAKPRFIYSIAVMLHVPRAELATYWHNILSLLHPGSTAVVNFDMAEKEMRIARKNWAYSESQVRNIIESICPALPLRFEVAGGPKRFAGAHFRRTNIIVGPF